MKIEDKDIEKMISQVENFGAESTQMSFDYNSDWEMTIGLRRKKENQKKVIQVELPHTESDPM